MAIAVTVVGWWGVGAASTRPAPDDATTNSAPNATIRVMTANVRIAEPTDGINIWPNRREFLVKTLLKYDPDIVGCQEVTPAQGAYLVKELAPWYDPYPRAGVGNPTPDSASLVGTVTETFASLNTLFFKTNRFDILDGEAGLVLPSQLQKDPAENTFYTLALLREKRKVAGQKAQYIVVDTHLRHQDDFALKCAAKIREKIALMLARYPKAQVIVMGDMNHDRDSRIYTALVGSNETVDGAGLLTDTFDYAKRGAEAWGNWHAFTGNPQRALPTDLIFTSPGLTAKNTQILRDKDAQAHYPSDHFFVLTELSKK